MTPEKLKEAKILELRINEARYDLSELEKDKVNTESNFISISKRHVGKKVIEGITDIVVTDLKANIAILEKEFDDLQ